jgi:uncharacterized protein (DUF433 family)
MVLPLAPDPIPLRESPPGVFRVGQTRVLLESVLIAFNDGESPESIAQQYDTLKLSDIYSVVAHYLRHREEFDEYLRRCEAEAEEVRRRIEASQPDMTDIRKRLLERRAQMGRVDAPSGE